MKTARLVLGFSVVAAAAFLAPVKSHALLFFGPATGYTPQAIDDSNTTPVVTTPDADSSSFNTDKMPVVAEEVMADCDVPVPEPASMLLMLSGLAGLAGLKKRSA